MLALNFSDLDSRIRVFQNHSYWLLCRKIILAYFNHISKSVSLVLSEPS